MQEVVTAFIRKNIVRLIVLGLLIFVATRKHIRFHINLSEPAMAMESKQKPLGGPPIEDTGRAAKKQEASVLEPFQLGWFGKKKTEKGSQPQKGGASWRAPLDPQAQDAFIRRFAHVAIAERKKFGIPSSLILAHGLLQSRAGYDRRVERGNNYFGLPCTPDWRGATITIEGTCYRAYETAWMSFRDHSLFLAKGPYAPQRPLLNSDYEGWIKELIANGYPAPSGYGEQVVELIERLQLFTIDQQES